MRTPFPRNYLYLIYDVLRHLGNSESFEVANMVLWVLWPWACDQANYNTPPRTLVKLAARDLPVKYRRIVKGGLH